MEDSEDFSKQMMDSESLFLFYVSDCIRSRSPDPTYENSIESLSEVSRKSVSIATEMASIDSRDHHMYKTSYDRMFASDEQRSKCESRFRDAMKRFIDGKSDMDKKRKSVNEMNTILGSDLGIKSRLDPSFMIGTSLGDMIDRFSAAYEVTEIVSSYTDSDKLILNTISSLLASTTQLGSIEHLITNSYEVISKKFPVIKEVDVRGIYGKLGDAVKRGITVRNDPMKQFDDIINMSAVTGRAKAVTEKINSSGIYLKDQLGGTWNKMFAGSKPWWQGATGTFGILGSIVSTIGWISETISAIMILWAMIRTGKSLLGWVMRMNGKPINSLFNTKQLKDDSYLLNATGQGQNFSYNPSTLSTRNSPDENNGGSVIVDNTVHTPPVVVINYLGDFNGMAEAVKNAVANYPQSSTGKIHSVVMQTAGEPLRIGVNVTGTSATTSTTIYNNENFLLVDNDAQIAKAKETFVQAIEAFRTEMRLCHEAITKKYGPEADKWPMVYIDLLSCASVYNVDPEEVDKIVEPQSGSPNSPTTRESLSIKRAALVLMEPLRETAKQIREFMVTAFKETVPEFLAKNYPALQNDSIKQFSNAVPIVNKLHAKELLSKYYALKLRKEKWKEEKELKELKKLVDDITKRENGDKQDLKISTSSILSDLATYYKGKCLGVLDTGGSLEDKTNKSAEAQSVIFGESLRPYLAFKSFSTFVSMFSNAAQRATDLNDSIRLEISAHMADLLGHYHNGLRTVILQVYVPREDNFESNSNYEYNISNSDGHTDEIAALDAFIRQDWTSRALELHPNEYFDWSHAKFTSRGLTFIEDNRKVEERNHYIPDGYFSHNYWILMDKIRTKSGAESIVGRLKQLSENAGFGAVVGIISTSNPGADAYEKFYVDFMGLEFEAYRNFNASYVMSSISRIYRLCSTKWQDMNLASDYGNETEFQSKTVESPEAASNFFAVTAMLYSLSEFDITTRSLFTSEDTHLTNQADQYFMSMVQLALLKMRVEAIDSLGRIIDSGKIPLKNPFLVQIAQREIERLKLEAKAKEQGLDRTIDSIRERLNDLRKLDMDSFHGLLNSSQFYDSYPIWKETAKSYTVITDTVHSDIFKKYGSSDMFTQESLYTDTNVNANNMLLDASYVNVMEYDTFKALFTLCFIYMYSKSSVTKFDTGYPESDYGFTLRHLPLYSAYIAHYTKQKGYLDGDIISICNLYRGDIAKERGKMSEAIYYEIKRQEKIYNAMLEGSVEEREQLNIWMGDNNAVSKQKQSVFGSQFQKIGNRRYTKKIMIGALHYPVPSAVAFGEETIYRQFFEQEVRASESTKISGHTYLPKFQYLESEAAKSFLNFSIDNDDDGDNSRDDAGVTVVIDDPTNDCSIQRDPDTLQVSNVSIPEHMGKIGVSHGYLISKLVREDRDRDRTFGELVEMYGAKAFENAMPNVIESTVLEPVSDLWSRSLKSRYGSEESRGSFDTWRKFIENKLTEEVQYFAVLNQKAKSDLSPYEQFMLNTVGILYGDNWQNNTERPMRYKVMDPVELIWVTVLSGCMFRDQLGDMDLYYRIVYGMKTVTGVNIPSFYNIEGNPNSRQMIPALIRTMYSSMGMSHLLKKLQSRLPVDVSRPVPLILITKFARRIFEMINHIDNGPSAPPSTSTTAPKKTPIMEMMHKLAILEDKNHSGANERHTFGYRSSLAINSCVTILKEIKKKVPYEFTEGHERALRELETILDNSIYQLHLLVGGSVTQSLWASKFIMGCNKTLHHDITRVREEHSGDNRQIRSLIYNMTAPQISYPFIIARDYADMADVQNKGLLNCMRDIATFFSAQMIYDDNTRQGESIVQLINKLLFDRGAKTQEDVKTAMESAIYMKNRLDAMRLKSSVSEDSTVIDLLGTSCYNRHLDTLNYVYRQMIEVLWHNGRMISFKIATPPEGVIEYEEGMAHALVDALGNMELINVYTCARLCQALRVDDRNNEYNTSDYTNPKDKGVIPRIMAQIIGDACGNVIVSNDIMKRFERVFRDNGLYSEKAVDDTESPYQSTIEIKHPDKSVGRVKIPSHDNYSIEGRSKFDNTPHQDGLRIHLPSYVCKAGRNEALGVFVSLRKCINDGKLMYMKLKDVMGNRHSSLQADSVNVPQLLDLPVRYVRYMVGHKDQFIKNSGSYLSYGSDTSTEKRESIDDANTYCVILTIASFVYPIRNLRMMRYSNVLLPESYPLSMRTRETASYHIDEDTLYTGRFKALLRKSIAQAPAIWRMMYDENRNNNRVVQVPKEIQDVLKLDENDPSFNTILQKLRVQRGDVSQSMETSLPTRMYVSKVIDSADITNGDPIQKEKVKPLKLPTTADYVHWSIHSKRGDKKTAVDNYRLMNPGQISAVLYGREMRYRVGAAKVKRNYALILNEETDLLDDGINPWVKTPDIIYE